MSGGCAESVKLPSVSACTKGEKEPNLRCLVGERAAFQVLLRNFAVCKKWCWWLSRVCVWRVLLTGFDVLRRGWRIRCYCLNPNLVELDHNRAESA